MKHSVDDQVLDFYSALFEDIFSKPFRQRISERRRLNPVIRQVEESAEAASSSLTRFFLSQKLSDGVVKNFLDSLSKISDFLELENIANPNITTEEIAENLLKNIPCPHAINQTHNSVYRLSLYTVVQVLMLVGPVMAEWQRLNFSSTFELPRRVVNRLNEISEQINAQGVSGQVGADENYELQYRDYLLQRFHRVEAGTVRMTTNLDVDLRELFVMPSVKVREHLIKDEKLKNAAAALLMDLTEARKVFAGFDEFKEFSETTEPEKVKQPHSALKQVKRASRNVLIGLPGVGKSTFFEWLQVKLASVEEKLLLGDGQAIPLLIRVRQLDMLNLPQGAALIEKATASKDRANLMPNGWVDRQMKAGRVLFMLDGLDETEPELCNKHLIPWLTGLIKNYPKCHYLISSRPVGYPAGLLLKQKFIESDLLDFDEPQIREYTQHWCTSVRLARNEAETEARREGEREGNEIVDGFREHPYIRNLARNPLMLSAICLINYFEGGKLPKDRARLYKLCVEGLLHNWDQRRGIHSEFGLSEKLRVCREVALAMQNADKAEADAKVIREIFGKVLKDQKRADRLLEHIRYRTGLLIERRANVFGFAHLTFQEYLAALAVYEGNLLGIDKEQLAREHDDGRWNEVIALYCGLSTAPDARGLIEDLIEQSDTIQLGEVLTEAFLSASSEIIEDFNLRRRVIERTASSPTQWRGTPLKRFLIDEVAPIANSRVGTIKVTNTRLSESLNWLRTFPEAIDIDFQMERLKFFYNLAPIHVAEIILILHELASDEKLCDLADIPGLYISKGPVFENGSTYFSQAEVALIGLRSKTSFSQESLEVLEKILSAFVNKAMETKAVHWETLLALNEIFRRRVHDTLNFVNLSKNKKMIATTGRLAKCLRAITSSDDGIFGYEDKERLIDSIQEWTYSLEDIENHSTRKRKISKKSTKNLVTKKEFKKQ